MVNLGENKNTKDMKEITLFEAFAGYGSQALGLRKANIPYRCVGFSEIDKYAIVAHHAIHGPVPNFGDITNINPIDLPDFNFFTYSFPCQDISLAGKQRGLEKDGGTRSGLLWECKKIIEFKKPKYLLMENVKNLVGKKFKPFFDEWCKELEELGYQNYWQVMNAKDYGIPQNRERVFMVSILGGGSFEFPEKESLELRLKDMLEDQVDDKYYLKPEQVKSINKSNFNTTKSRIQTKEYCATLCARDYKDPKCVAVAYAQRGRNPENPTSRVVGLPTEQRLESNGSEVSNCLTTVQKDSLVGIQQVGNIVSTGNFANPQRGRIYSKEGISPALNCCGGGGLEPKIINDLKIRKLTPLECFKLMGVSVEDFYKVRKALNETFYKGKDRSSSQLYKLAGNSIVAECVEKISLNLFNPTPDKKLGKLIQLTLF